MSGHNCTYNGHLHTRKRKEKKAIFTVRGHVVEAQHLA